MLAFFGKVCYNSEAVTEQHKYPGVAKFGIALEWGSRGLEFESRHSDQSIQIRTFYQLVKGSDLLFILHVPIKSS